MVIAPNLHASLHVPKPKHPNLQALDPEFKAAAALQSDIPSYSYLSLALSHVPLQITFATIFHLLKHLPPLFLQL